MPGASLTPRPSPQPPSHFPSDLLPNFIPPSVAELLNEKPTCTTAITVEAFIDWLGSHAY